LKNKNGIENKCKLTVVSCLSRSGVVEWTKALLNMANKVEHFQFSGVVGSNL